jgi:hypothetical protein
MYDVIVSDHKPVAFCVDFTLGNVITSSTEPSDLPMVIPQWHLCSEPILSLFHNTVDKLLQNIVIPVFGDDACNTEIYSGIENFYASILKCLQQACDSCIPSNVVSNSCYNIAGWNTYVREKHDAAREAFLTWRASGSARFGFDYDTMRRTRSQFKLALRFCRDHIEQMKADAFANAIQDKDAWKFWSKVRLISNNRATGQVTNVNGASGDKDIASMWQQHFKQVYSAGCNSRHKEIYLNKISSGGYRHDSCITLSEVLIAIQDQKLGKSVGPDGISMEVFAHGGLRLAVMLTLLFNMFLKYCYVPANFSLSVMLPLVKNKAGNLSDKDNYRAIAVANSSSKIFEAVIYNYFNELDNIDSDVYQFGFKSNHSTDICTYVLKSTIDYYNNNGSHVFACFVDFNKAFDNVDYWLLFCKMLDMWDDSKYHSFTLLLANWYNNQFAFVRWHNVQSEHFKVFNGVRQGGILSPLLFRLYVRELICKITDLRVGCNLGGFMINLLCYADDMVLIAPSWRALQYLITCLHLSAADIYMSFNIKKTVCMIFNPRCRRKIICSDFPAFSVDSNELQTVSEFKYLGHIISSDCRDDIDIKREIKSLFTRCNILKSRYARCSFAVKIRLFRAYCICLYGTALWTKYCASSMTLLTSCYNKCLKHFFGYAKYHSVTAMLLELGLPCLSTLIHNARHNLRQRLLNCDNALVNEVLICCKHVV